MSDLKSLVTQYVEARGRRATLEAEAKHIKASQEDPLKEMILNELAAQSLKTANITGLGTIVTRQSTHYEIVDAERLALLQLKSLADAGNAGTPLAEALFLQRRISREQLESFTGGVVDDAFLTDYGVRLVAKNDLAFTKEKNGVAKP